MKTFFVYILTALLLLFCVESKSYQTSSFNTGQLAISHVPKTSHSKHSLQKTNHPTDKMLTFSLIEVDNEQSFEHYQDSLLVLGSIIGLVSLLFLNFKKVKNKILKLETHYNLHVKRFILLRVIRI